MLEFLPGEFELETIIISTRTTCQNIPSVHPFTHDSTNNSDHFLKSFMNRNMTSASRKKNTPMATDAHPELDDSELLSTEDHEHYQQIMDNGLF